jgi:hypothetical protein
VERYGYDHEYADNRWIPERRIEWAVSGVTQMMMLTREEKQIREGMILIAPA